MSVEWNADQREFIGWLIEIAVTDWKPETEWPFVELVERVITYLETLFEMNTGTKVKLHMGHLTEMRDALIEDREPEAAAGMQLIIDRGIEEYRRTGQLN